MAPSRLRIRWESCTASKNSGTFSGSARYSMATSTGPSSGSGCVTIDSFPQWFHASNEPLAAGNRATTGSARQAAMPMLENSSAVFALVCSAATPQSVLPSANASLKHEKVNRQHPRPHPVGHKILHQRVERGHEHRPRCASKQNQKAEQRQPVQGRKRKNYTCEHHCRSRNNPLDRQFTARALQHHRPYYRTHSEKPEQQSITERTLRQPSCHCREQRPERTRKEDHAGRAKQQLLNVG